MLQILYSSNGLLSAWIVFKQLYGGIFRALKHSMRAGVYKSQWLVIIWSGFDPPSPPHPLGLWLRPSVYLWLVYFFGDEEEEGRSGNSRMAKCVHLVNLWQNIETCCPFQEKILSCQIGNFETTGLGQELNWPFYPFCGSYDDNHCDDNDDNHYGDNDDDHYEDNEDDNVIEVHRVWLLDH